MVYDLEAFCADCRDILLKDQGPKGRHDIRQRLERLLVNSEFLESYFGPDAEIGVHTLYHDPETDVHVLAHINDSGRTSPPHDHGRSWAIYGQAIEHTVMTDWNVTEETSDDGRPKVKEVKNYRLDPGMVGVYDPGQIHSISFPDRSRFVRVTGTDLGNADTRRFESV